MISLEQKIFYNEASSAKLGWKPWWFGVDEFNETLINAIKEFQLSYVDLTPDGLCGPQTYRRAYTALEANNEKKKHILCNGTLVPIRWSKFIGLNDDNNLKLSPHTYKNITGKRFATKFVVHWDASLNSKRTKDILEKRGYSVHFLIDNDGTIYQSVDTNNVCWHAPPLNFTSIGVEISNAVYKNYQDWYVRNGYGPRPIYKNVKCHGRNYGDILGFYPVQIQALKALIESVTNHYDIPLQVPCDSKGKMILKADPGVYNLEFNGICCHYHASENKNKWDCAGLDLQSIVKEIKKESE